MKPDALRRLDTVTGQLCEHARYNDSNQEPLFRSEKLTSDAAIFILHHQPLNKCVQVPEG